MDYIIHSIEEMDELALSISSSIKPKKEAFVIALKGDLGSGKTTFSQSFARSLGVNDSVTSPTYVIQKSYSLKESVFSRIIHIDAYRLESEKELITLGFRDILKDSKNIILIEWPERISSLIPENTFWIEFDHVGEGVRKVSIQP